MLIIFDVDGTLIGGESTDWSCFDGAFHAAVGRKLDAAFWETITEVTAQAIVHEALAGRNIDERRHTEHAVRTGYLERLRESHAQNPHAFKAVHGAGDLLAHLRTHPHLRAAIATGDWHDSISFKLKGAGIDTTGLPMATASDCYSRAEIISLAASRAGWPLGRTVYVGDGPWDFRATRKLNIPFIGVGRRHEALRAAGARHTLPDLQPVPFLRIIDELMSATTSS